jgi:hypothetical protein
MKTATVAPQPQLQVQQPQQLTPEYDDDEDEFDDEWDDEVVYPLGGARMEGTARARG